MEAEIFESFYDSMSQRDKYHMANKLYKVDEIGATKLVNELHALKEVAKSVAVPVYNVGDVVRCLDCGYTWGETTGVILDVGNLGVHVTVDNTDGVSPSWNTKEGYSHSFDEIEHIGVYDERNTD